MVKTSALVICIAMVNAAFATDFSVNDPATLVRSKQLAKPSLRTGESLVWNRMPESLKGNRYIPASQQSAVSVEQGRLRVADFYAVLDARDRTLAGRATRADKALYEKALRDDLLQRQQVLNHLRKQYPKASSERAQIEAKVVDVQARLRRLARASSTVSGAAKHEKSAAVSESAKTRMLCVQDRYSLITCLGERDALISDMRGHWVRRDRWTTDVLAEGRAYDMLQKLNGLLKQTGEDTIKDTTLVCSQGLVLAFNRGAAQTAGSASTTSPTGLPSFADMRGMASACSYLNALTSFSNSVGSIGNSVGGSGAGLGGTNSGWVDEQIGAIDQEVSNCVESPTGLVAMDWRTFGEEYLGLILSKDALRAYGRAMRASAFWEVLSLPNDMGEEYNKQLEEANQIRQAEVDAVAAESGAATAAYDAQVAQDDAQVAATKAQEAAEAADADPTSTEKAEVAAKAKKDADEAAEKAKNAAEDAAAKAAAAEKKRKEAEEKKKAASATATQGTGTQMGTEIGSGSACSGLLTWWSSFKAECNRTQGWDKAGSECNDLLRRRNGCVDPRLILTDPEAGDTTCQRATLSEQEFLTRACAKQQQLMSALEPGQLNCSTLTRPSPDAGRPSVCGNPLVNLTEEQWARQCGSDVPLPGSHLSPPTIYYGGTDASILDGIGMPGRVIEEGSMPPKGPSVR